MQGSNTPPTTRDRSDEDNEHVEEMQQAAREKREKYFDIAAVADKLGGAVFA